MSITVFFQMGHGHWRLMTVNLLLEVNLVVGDIMTMTAESNLA